MCLQKFTLVQPQGPLSKRASNGIQADSWLRLFSLSTLLYLKPRHWHIRPNLLLNKCYKKTRLHNKSHIYWLGWHLGMCLVIKMCHTRMALNGQWRKKEALPPVCLRLSTSSVRLLPPSCWGFKKGERSSLLLALTAGRMKPSFVSQVSCIGSVMIWTCLEFLFVHSAWVSR